MQFYSHVNYSVTKMRDLVEIKQHEFYSHVNYSVTKIIFQSVVLSACFTVT